MQRQGHVLRRLKQKDHPHLKEMGPDVSMGIDFVSPHDHSIPECRHRQPGTPRDPSTQATDAECAARSAIHHISIKHGVDPETITKMTTQLNIDLGKSMYRAAQMFGATKEGSDRSREEANVKTADESAERRRKELKEHWALMTVEERAEHVAKNAVRHKPREQHEKLEHAMRERKRRRKLDRSEAVANMPYMMAVWHSAGIWTQTGAHTVTQLAGHAAAHITHIQNWTHSASGFANSILQIGRRKTLGAQLKLLRNRKHRVGSDVTMDNLQSHIGAGYSVLAQMTPSHLQAMASIIAADPSSSARHIVSNGHAVGMIVDKTSIFAEAAVDAHNRHRRMQSNGIQEAIDLIMSEEEKTLRGERARVIRQMYQELERLQLLERARRNASSARGRRARQSFQHFGHKTKERRVETPHVDGRRLLKTGGPVNFPKWYASTYGWVSTAIDYRFWFHEAQRVAEADIRRMGWWSSGAQGDIPKHARTGYRFLDMRVPPTIIGRAMRKFGLRLSNRTAYWESDKNRRRALETAVWQPNPLDSGRKLRDIAMDPKSWAEFDMSADGIIKFIESRDHRTRTRRLSELTAHNAENYVQGVARSATTAAGVASSFLESGIRSPVHSNPLSNKNMQSSKLNPMGSFEVLLRYTIFNTALCYLYPEHEEDANTQFSSEHNNEMQDGTPVRTHGTSRLCFPAGE